MPLTIRFRAASLALLTLLLLAPARAHGWSSNANLNTPIATGPGYQFIPYPLEDGSGGVFISWCAGTATTLDIYVQHYDATGSPLWTPGGVVVCDAPGNQAIAPMVSDGAGGIVLVWNDFRNGTDYDLYARRVNAAGVPQGTANGVPITIASGDQICQAAISDGAGGMIFPWTDDRDLAGDYYAQRIDASATPMWAANGVPICVAPGGQSSLGVTTDGSGGAFFSWDDTRGGPENDIYAQRISAGGTPLWTLDGVLVSGAPAYQFSPKIASDEAGGAFVVWSDIRDGGASDLYAQRLSRDGSTLWRTDGRRITSLPTGELNPRITADGTGGCFIAWDDYRASIVNTDPYAQRLAASGAPLWAVDGVPICVLDGGQDMVQLISDGKGGAIALWHDPRNDPTDVDLYAQRISETGSPRWTLNGIAVSTAPTHQVDVLAVTDGNHGLIVVFSDRRNGIENDSFAQRVEQFGYLGDPEPELVSVRDVAGDQGGRVRLSWNASYLDTGPGSPVNEYRLWRQVPVTALAGPGTFRTEGNGTNAVYWEFIGSQPSNGFPSYSLAADTESDSVAGSNPLTVFMVEARQTSTGFHWDSAPDSGYSVDNLAPPTPSPFTGSYAGGTASLQWGASLAPDLAGYRLYRGASSNFVPSPINRIASTTLTSYQDAAAPHWYKLSAVDVHGNESSFATLQPGGTVDVASGPARELRLGPPTPNPARAGTAFRLALPYAAAVKAEFFDQQGRLVRALDVRHLEAGDHELAWDGRQTSGAPVSSGLYFYRVSIGERRMEGRIAIIH